MELEIEQLEIRDFLAECPPLRTLDETTLNQLTLSIEIAYARRGHCILEPDSENHYYFLIRSGAAEVLTPEGMVYSHVGEGEWFGYRSSMRDGKVFFSVKAMEDSLLYLMPNDLMQKVSAKNQSIAQYFNEKRSIRLRQAIHDRKQQPFGTISTTPISRLMRRPIEVAAQATIQDAVKIMSDLNSNLILIKEQEQLIGLVTDHDLRDRVVAVGKYLQAPVTDIMTSPAITIDVAAGVVEAQLLMAQYNIDELPVMKEGLVMGVVTTRDLIKAQGQNPVFLVSEIYRARKLSKLYGFASQIPELLYDLVAQRLSSVEIGKIITTVGEAINIRLLQLAEEAFGEPPIPYAWGIAGSMARQEQIAHSDQDNALILSNAYIEEEHGAYFKQLAKYVSDGLHACGYIYCPGNVMATNQDWRQSTSEWLKKYKTWVETPEPKALMYASIFFDMRVLYGDATLFDPIKQYIQKSSPKNSIFLSYMMANSLQHRPPLGFFRNFVLEDHGDHEDVLNLKKRGVIPVVDMARVCGLANAVEGVSTIERLQASALNGGLSHEGSRDLQDAYEVINNIRLQHQANAIELGQSPNNYVSPDDMSSLEKRHLKDAFHIVNTMQEAISHQYRVELL